MEEFLPEGALINTEKNKYTTSSKEALKTALNKKTIVEGTAILCDAEHNLTVDFGSARGIIPHNETALGIDDGKTREIAIISRVGKPVSCIITDTDEDGNFILSRRQAQEMALSSFFETMRPGDVIPATVTHLEPFGAFCDIGCGNISLLGIESLSISRISHPSDRFSEGDNIFAVISRLDEANKRVFLSHRELLGTWEENAERFEIGQTVRGIVRGIEEYGIFVELAPNLSGLAEFRDDVEVGDLISVFIKNIIPEKMKIKLVIIDKLENAFCHRIKQTDYFISSGHISTWCYSPPYSDRVKGESVF
ncbi:MAG: 30S ribosomal protein S1 [Oscillospiraceae bacterium]|nr:30S ribosomal protein S1 [Oscillospiraceae bacterium]